MKKKLFVDFDGVLHRYSKGWHDGTIYDGPVEGAREAMAHLLASGYEVWIYSTRNYGRIVKGVLQRDQCNEIATWLTKYEIPCTGIYDGAGKPRGHLFIDDNAVRFDGNWSKTTSEVESFKNWTKKIREEADLAADPISVLTNYEKSI